MTLVVKTAYFSEVWSTWLILGGAGGAGGESFILWIYSVISALDFTIKPKPNPCENNVLVCHYCLLDVSLVYVTHLLYTGTNWQMHVLLLEGL